MELLGWEHARDETQLKKEHVRDNFVEKVVKGPIFTNRLRLNELFELKKIKIHEDIIPPSVLAWANSLLKQFSLLIRAGEKTYQLEIKNGLMSSIERKNKNGRFHSDGRHLLNQKVRKQIAEEEDLFWTTSLAQQRATSSPKHKWHGHRSTQHALTGA